MVLASFLIVLGFAILIKGADWLVDGSVALAKKYGVSDLMIGLTVVAFGTSAPELVVNTIASWQGRADFVLGNIIGSNIFNLFMILGVSGIILPITVKSITVWREIPISVVATIGLLLLGNDFFLGGGARLSRLDGILLLVGFVCFFYLVVFRMKSDEDDEKILSSEKPAWMIWGLIVLGLAGLIIGGKVVVQNAVVVASKLGVSEKMIGLTILAAGTSLPELVTAVVAALRKNSDLIIGNVIGSNIFNILLILSVSSLIRPVPFGTNFNFDLFLLLGGSVFLFVAMFTGRRKKIDRWEAGLLFVFFFLYMAYLIGKEV
jgi:cation:H+ antiporter